MVIIRKKNRLWSWLYSKWYFFVTICVQNKQSYFWDADVGADNIRLNVYWKIIEEYRYNISSIHKNVILESFVVMPNHIHGIISIDANEAIDNRPYGELSKIIKWFKRASSKRLHEIWLTDFKRQRSFYDHVIRNEKDLQRIQEYIELNPYKRENDEYYLW
jgi:REP element-mobilizing transposase RayT